MAKRFLETTLWTQNKWFRKLIPFNKLFWIYLLTNCDNVGVWEVDIELASFVIGEKYENDVIKVFTDRVLIMPNAKIWIKDFCDFQYGLLDEHNTNNKPHQSYVKLLKKHRLWKDYTRSIQWDKEKDKDKDKKKDKDKDKDGLFEKFWKLYPRKIDKVDARASFINHVKEKEFDDLIKAIDNYNKHIVINKTESKYIKHGSTFLNKERWKEWINIKTEGKNETTKTDQEVASEYSNHTKFL